MIGISLCSNILFQTFIWKILSVTLTVIILIVFLNGKVKNGVANRALKVILIPPAVIL